MVRCEFLSGYCSTTLIDIFYFTISNFCAQRGEGEGEGEWELEYFGDQCCRKYFLNLKKRSKHTFIMNLVVLDLISNYIHFPTLRIKWAEPYNFLTQSILTHMSAQTLIYLIKIDPQTQLTKRKEKEKRPTNLNGYYLLERLFNDHTQWFVLTSMTNQYEDEINKPRKPKT